MYCVYIVHRSNIRCICTTICIDGKFIVQIMFNISILNIHYIQFIHRSCHSPINPTIYLVRVLLTPAVHNESFVEGTA